MYKARIIFCFFYPTGPRYLDEDEKAKEEDNTLCDYLSKCKYDPNSGDGQMMSLPDPNDMLLPEGFECQFYREAKESFYQATMDGESFTIIILEQKDWDSDGSKKRDKNQVLLKYMTNCAKLINSANLDKRSSSTSCGDYFH